METRSVSEVFEALTQQEKQRPGKMRSWEPSPSKVRKEVTGWESVNVKALRRLHPLHRRQP